MKTSNLTLRYGILIAVALISYFFIVRALGLIEVYWLRLLNGVILGYGIYLCIKKSKESNDNHVDYFEGIGTGLKSGLIATILFVVFLAVYIYHLDSDFSARLMEKLGWNINNPEKILLVTIFIEGVASTVILSLTFMQLFKTSWNLDKNHD